uniref:DNA-(apurinic or apyrimidinic site) lyase n=1 Tax=Eptatretus burgeri TaxID=7764 RepID=A0A8C4WTC2_EPTBU
TITPLGYPCNMERTTLAVRVWSRPVVWYDRPVDHSRRYIGRLNLASNPILWKETAPGHWTGVLAERVWTLTQDENLRKSNPKAQRKAKDVEEGSKLGNEAILKDYLQLGVCVENLHEDWTRNDPHLSQVAAWVSGVRILRQDPLECLFAFICSSNNNLSRITLLVNRLCEAFGCKLLQLDDRSYYSFPCLHRLAGKGVEEKLRSLGFGYRAAYVPGCAREVLARGGIDWLHGLRLTSYREAWTQLCSLAGVGPKVCTMLIVECQLAWEADICGAHPSSQRGKKKRDEFRARIDFGCVIVLWFRLG